MGKMNPRTSFLDHIGSSAASSETEKVLGAEEREGDRDWEGEGSRQKEERGTRKREGELKARGFSDLWTQIESYHQLLWFSSLQTSLSWDSSAFRIV
ncbi:uncharacterized protein [Macaca nemestrina]